MSRYFVTLKPIDSFFFGSERVFKFKGDSGTKDVNKNQNKKEYDNNLIKSTMFPQQTSILGMLRKEILIEENLFSEKWDYSPEKREKMNKKIGRESFKLNETEAQDFGVINEICPVFIKYGEKYLIRVPKDHKVEEDDDSVKNNNSHTVAKYKPLRFDKGNKCRSNLGEEIFLPVDFKGKTGISEDFMDIKNTEMEIIKSSDIFKEEHSIGIKLNDNHSTEEDSLFRLIKYKFTNKEISFAFIADVDLDLDGHKNIVSLGGEGSFFYISFEKISSTKDLFDFKKEIKNIEVENEVYQKIILLSDTYIRYSDYEKYCKYSVASTISFRNLITKKSAIKRESADSPEKQGYYESFDISKEKYFLLERGSVLYTSDEFSEELVRAISNENMRKIGYNIFI
jgi:CRISPR-associated protein Cmr3